MAAQCVGYRNDGDGSVEIDQHRAHNESNQITKVDGTNAGVAYDQNGNMVRVPTGEALTGPPRHLKWNAWNQLVEVRNASNQLLQQNVYDALFRRVTRELGDSSVIHCYYNEKWRPIEERFGSSSDPSVVYFWGARHRDDLARRDRDTDANGTLDESLWCLMDYFDPVAVIDDEGDVVERYAFTAFGVAGFLAPDYSPRTSSAVAWDFLSHGQFEDAETGWQNYGFRFYVPELGRWPNRDPIEERGGVNFYTYVHNAAINRNDRFGLADGGWNAQVTVTVTCTCSDGSTCKNYSESGQSGGASREDAIRNATNVAEVKAHANLDKCSEGDSNCYCVDREDPQGSCRYSSHSPNPDLTFTLPVTDPLPPPNQDPPDWPITPPEGGPFNPLFPI